MSILQHYIVILLMLVLSACVPQPKDPTFYPDCSYKNKGVNYEVHNFFYHLEPIPRANCVLAPDVGNLYDSRILYSYKLPNLKVGEEIRAYIQWEMTNDMPDNMMVAWFWVLSDGPNSWQGTQITDALGENITPDKHHAVYQAWGFHKVVDPKLNHLNLVVYGASDAAINGKHIMVEDYGTVYIRRE